MHVLLLLLIPEILTGAVALMLIKRVRRCSLLAIFAALSASAQAPQIPLTGNVGAGGNFAFRNAVPVSMADANHTLVYPETSAGFVKVTSSVTLTAQRNLVEPNLLLQQCFENLTSGGQSIQVIGGSGTGVVIANGTYACVQGDGTNYVTTASGGSGDTITSPGSTLSVGGSPTNTTVDVNLAHANTWTAPQTFGGAGPAFEIPLSVATGTGSSATNVGSDSAGNILLNKNGVAAEVCDTTNAACGAGGSGNPYTSTQEFGDSITQGTGATTFMQPGIKGQSVTWLGDTDYSTATYPNGPTAYAYLLQSDYGNGGFNYGRGGDLSTDMAWHNAIWAHPTLQNNPMRTGMIGTNDNSLCGTVANCQDTTTKAELFSAANSVIPDTVKAFASTCTTTGSWTADSNLPGAMYTTTSGATMSCTFPSTTTKVYVAYEKCDNTGNTAAGTLGVNGSPGTLEPTISFFGLGGSSIFLSNGTSFASGSGLFSHCSLALARNGGTVGSNTVLFTSTNSTKTEIFWMAGGYTAAGTAPPVYVVGGVPYEAANAGQPGVGQYNTIAHGVATTLAGDGLNVVWADVQAVMNFTTDFTGGTQASGDVICGVNSPNGSPWAATWLSPLHPGDGGMCHIYEAFHNAITAPASVQSQALSIWAGPSGSITGANSLGGRYGADGGLNGVGAASLLSFKNSGSAATVGHDFAVPGYDKLGLYYYGSGNAAGVAGAFSLADVATSVHRMVFLNDGTLCLNVTFANTNNCVNGMAYLPSSHPWLGIGTTAPNTFYGFTVDGAMVNVNNHLVTAQNPRFVAEATAIGTQPEFHLINDNATFGDYNLSVDASGNLSFINCNSGFGTCNLMGRIAATGKWLLGNLQLGGVTGSTQCLQADTSGNVAGTGAGCGSSRYPQVTSEINGTSGSWSAGLKFLGAGGAGVPAYQLNIVGSQSATTLNATLTATPAWVRPATAAYGVSRMVGGLAYGLYELSLGPTGSAGSTITDMDTTAFTQLSQGGASGNCTWFNSQTATPDTCNYALQANPAKNFLVDFSGGVNATNVTDSALTPTKLPVATTGGKLIDSGFTDHMDGTADFAGTFSATNLSATNVSGNNVQGVAYFTNTNCVSSASPAVCGSAPAGSVVIAAGATTVTVNTSVVTPNSQIILTSDDSLGTRLGVTCNSTLSTALAGIGVTGRTTSTSFTITTLGTVAVNPMCLSYWIVN